jgi:hypothetical protein
MSRPDLNRIAADLEAEAFQRGWNAAIAAIMAAVNSQPIPKPENNSTSIPAQDLFKPKRKRMRGFRSDSTVSLVLDKIKHIPGLTGVEIVNALQEKNPKIEERTVRTALRRLRIKYGQITNQEGRWYLAE